MASDVQVYGTDWCGVTFGVREYLNNARIAYEYYDIDRDRAAAEFVRTMCGGALRSPMVVIQERIITTPTLGELQTVLDNHGIRPQRLGSRRRTGGPLRSA